MDTGLFQDSNNEKTSKKIEDEGKVIKSFKFDIEELLDKAQEWIIEVQQKMDGLTSGNVIPTSVLGTATSQLM